MPKTWIEEKHPNMATYLAKIRKYKEDGWEQDRRWAGRPANVQLL
jgi:hypothetical protein